ncbi:MAG: bifunctional 4-hydroxy-2-oxoglutarate aldolase/2-dehydro-3-deoxy-phosphogluconate aldolase [Treponema sp.]|jgi:2-dehydro-3-deoxyphosphogluconate aldolase/(4S)-4-hydroxy-2-oxoglutarate aldolase|nr:bifunctional 4-hydroxy-2-oxoglutarate aldolase/2-dehydro-3-deoxy-phosphogluconate aldolase [Treponema sp.]
MQDKLRLVAIIRNVDPGEVVPITEALLEEGINSVELSLSDPEKGFSCIEELKKRHFEELYIGAGTVMRQNEVDRLAAAGVKYFFCAGFDGTLVDYAASRDLLAIPGVLTPSEVQQCIVRGMKLLKLFPANVFHTRYIKDLHGPFPGAAFLAVGGVGPDNFGEYLKAGFWGAGIGGSLVPQGANREQIPQIREAAKKCIAVLNGDK